MKFVKMLLFFSYFVFMNYYCKYLEFTVFDQTTLASTDIKPNPKEDAIKSIDEVLFVDDYIIAQQKEWQKDPNRRHCPSGILSPYLATMNQIYISRCLNHSQGSTPVIYFDTRVLYPKYNISLPKNCAYKCIYTDRSEEAVNASIAVFTRSPTSEMVSMFKNALWAFDSNEAPIRMSPIHHDYRERFSIFLTSSPNSTVPKPYGMYVAHNRPECVMSATARQFLRRHVDARHLLPANAAFKDRLVAWLVSNTYALNQRKLYVAQLRRRIPVDIYGYRRLNCNRANCLKELGRRYKFYLAIENSNCRAYITEKLFKNSLRHGMVPIVMGGSREDYFNQAPPNSYIHVDDFDSPAHLAAYLRYLASNETAYASYFAWKELGSIQKAGQTFCRLCALYHRGHLQCQSPAGLGVHRGRFEEHLNPWRLCIGPYKWPSSSALRPTGPPAPPLTILSLLLIIYRRNFKNSGYL